MIIILKNIPAKTKKRDIKNFIDPVAKGNWLKKSGQIKSILFLTQKNIRTNIIQNHVLVEVLPDSVAERVIKKLNRKMLLDSYIAVCEYKIRNWHNDPRINHSHANNYKNFKNKRICERRDPHEEIVSDDIDITSEKSFHTKGW
ncbi:MAG: hypothetical protein LUO95_07100 [Methylococcaceae bacterium]|nr:hypothetical protein [Methylococcaceae bacterium]MDD1607691.1 hypothetical protein [Methylococcaceae bacterium]MDD1610361.1 hypothetical protein [Methylococcaceae bacterium]MDD1615476.1 hypothetical protein [Methylococcaceae bacterium]OYV20232.1 MAG: hypothetical protein CG439_564 [Methylococcaceae bacterium NSP1-2]